MLAVSTAGGVSVHRGRGAGGGRGAGSRQGRAEVSSRGSRGQRERRGQRDGQTEREGTRARAAEGERSGPDIWGTHGVQAGQRRLWGLRAGGHNGGRGGRGQGAEAATLGAECEPGLGGGSGGTCRWAQGQGIRAGARRARQAWDRAVTCWGPVNTQPKGLLSHAYEIGGSTEVLAPVTLGYIGQAEARVGLRTLTDPRLRGQETRLRRGGPAGHAGMTAEELALTRTEEQPGGLPGGGVETPRGGRSAHTGHSCPSRTPTAHGPSERSSAGRSGRPPLGSQLCRCQA